MKTIAELRAERAQILTQAKELAEKAEQTAEDRSKIDELIAKADELAKDIERRERIALEMAKLAKSTGRAVDNAKSVSIATIGLGDTEERAYAQWVRTGDDGAIKELRASNDTTMNITTDVDGGFAVPTGHYNGIIAKRDEGALTKKLGLTKIPGKGTTVNIPVDNEDDGEFVVTGESVAYDRDAPAIGQVVSTLVKYTKTVHLTVELLEDEDSKLLEFLNDFVGRGIAKTQNGLLLAEVAANGTLLKTFASATAVAVDEIEPIVYNDTLGPYLDDGGSVAWVMRRTVHGELLLLDDTSIRRYAENAMGNTGVPQLMNYPVYYSAKSGATAASAKSLFFGNWAFVGYREAPGITVIRDPYTRGMYGEVLFYYMFRCDYVVLQPAAIGYAGHPSA